MTLSKKDKEEIRWMIFKEIIAFEEKKMELTKKKYKEITGKEFT